LPLLPLLDHSWKEADEMLTLLIRRAAELINYAPGSLEDKEFDQLASAIEAHEAKRWPALEMSLPAGQLVGNPLNELPRLFPVSTYRTD
jgi:hypothetical protein